MANGLSYSPVSEKRGGRRIRSRFLHFLSPPVCTAFSFAALFVLLFSGIAFFLLKYGHADLHQNATNRIPAVVRTPVPELREVTGIFDKRQTITQAFMAQGISADLIGQIVECARPDYNLAIVKAGEPYWIRFASDGSFRDFRYPVDDERYLTVYHDVAQNRLISVMKNFSYDTRVETVSAAIEDSLFESVLGIGEKDQLALDIAEIFGSDIDFYSDLQSGDSFKVLIEKKYIDGQFAKYGVILAAAFNNKKRLLTGFRFEDENGKPAYYAPDGKSLKRSFLKSPLKFARVSSKFSYARRHPILRTVRPHLGVDYAARAGTPVQAVGAGVVTSAGYSGGNGRMVRLRHSGGYETMYLHLSKIAVRSGARVSQGQVIGYVGSTGLSTGPHLDFRVFRKGKAINPLKVIFPPGAPVSPDLFGMFAALRDKFSSQLQITNYE